MYKTDFYCWTKEQVELLQTGQFDLLDINNLVEEIESLGRLEKRLLKNSLSTWLEILLKIEYYPDQAKGKLSAASQVAKHEVESILKENISLITELQEIIEDAYFTARLYLLSETGVEEDFIPEECPWTVIFRKNMLLVDTKQLNAPKTKNKKNS
jgi:hypothetical protein